MHLWRFGHYGVPVLVLPSAAGIAHEWQYNGLIDALRPLIEVGRLKLYCTESNVSESWADETKHPADRLRRHRAFERYLVEELVPFIRADCGSDDIRLAVAGASLGAMYAANLTLKFPEAFFYALCLSGRYDSTWLTAGFSNDDVYFSNPMAFVPGLAGEPLDRLRRAVHLDLVCGEGAYEGANPAATRAFADVLLRQRIPHRLDLWNEASHEPAWWSRQVRFYLGRRFGIETSSQH
jgi:esterase/lipase superfamily enzyme